MFKYESERNFKFDGNYESPGPGAYTPELRTTRLRTTIQGKYESKPPEPPLSGELKHTSWAPAKRPTSEFKSRTKRTGVFDSENAMTISPSPTSYQKTERSTLKVKTQTVGNFGSRALRFHDLEENGPGPGAYDPKAPEWTGSQRGCKIHVKSKQKKKDLNTPGPGSYNISPQWERRTDRPKSSFGSARRLEWSENPDTPGPGSYFIDRSIRIHGIEMHGARNNHNSIFNVPTRDTPAPGSYQSQSSLSSRGSTISRQERFRETVVDTPGPGSYNVTAGPFIKRSYHVEYLKNLYN